MSAETLCIPVLSKPDTAANDFTLVTPKTSMTLDAIGSVMIGCNAAITF